MSGKKRSSQKNKQFICPCGKQYLSYPALYTHIKTSHQGKAPGIIQRPVIPNRGRPKICQEVRVSHYRKSLISNLNSDLIQQFTRKIILQYPSENKDSKLLTQNLSQIIKTHQKLYFQFCRYIEQQKGSNKDNGVFVNEDNLFLIKTGNGLADFVIQLQIYLSQPHYSQSLLIIIMLLRHMQQETGQQEILQTSYAGFVVQFFNDFILNGYDQSLYHLFQKKDQKVVDNAQKRHELDSSDILNQQDRKIIYLQTKNIFITNKKSVIDFLGLLGKWLAFNKYTMTKATINQKFQQ